MARGFLAFAFVNLALTLLLSQGWKGPRIAYIDIYIYPFYCVFAANAVSVAVASRAHSRAGILVLCALPWLVLIDYQPPPLERPMVRNANPFIWPPAQTPVTKLLAREIALRPGSMFRGRVASVAGSDFEASWVSAPFINQHNYDAMSLLLTGNDHRMYGMWYYDIPTLFEANQFSSPFFHLVNARLLNSRDTKDLRSFETQSIVNDRIMALLGVRYLLSDKLLPEGTPVFSYRLTQGRDLHVYSVANTNVAGYAATTVRRATSGQDAIALLADSAFDPRSTALLTTSDELPPLVPVSSSSLTIERGSYRIEADSPGNSLLVLPIEYSHCLQANLTTTGARPARLFRVDLALTGILFSGRVEGSLALRYGPLSSGCRIEDWREAEALRIDEARDWPEVPPESKIATPLEQLLSEKDALLGQQAVRLSQLEQLLAEKNALLAEKDTLLGQRASRITELERLLAERDALLVEKNTLLAEKNGLLAEKSTLLAEKNGLLAEKDTRIAELQRSLAERDALLEQRLQRISHLDQLLAGKNASFEQQALRISELEGTLQAVYSSRSWKMTAPVRKIINWLRR
jgi:hypothetical protein